MLHRWLDLEEFADGLATVRANLALLHHFPATFWEVENMISSLTRNKFRHQILRNGILGSDGIEVV